MKNESGDARAAILRRRAVFVTTALGALSGCPQDQPSKPDPVVGVEPASTTASMPANTGEPLNVPPAQPAGKRPSLEIPKGVGATAKMHYEGLATQVPKIDAEIDEANKALADVCNIEDHACDDKWLAVADHIQKAKDQLDELPPMCRGSSAEAKAFDQRLEEHEQYLSKRLEAVESRVQSILETDPQRSRWKILLDSKAVPKPCLDYSCEEW